MAIDTEKELFEIKKLVEENNKILHGMRRKSRFATFFYIIKWTVIAFIAFGVYTFVQPIINTFMASYNTVVESADQIRDIKDSMPSFDIKNLFNKE
jgi:hypothetical protein